MDISGHYHQSKYRERLILKKCRIFERIVFSPLNDREKGKWWEINKLKSILPRMPPFRFYRVGSILKVNLILYPLANKTQVRIIILAESQGDAEHNLFVILLLGSGSGMRWHKRQQPFGTQSKNKTFNERCCRREVRKRLRLALLRARQSRTAADVSLCH